MKMLKVKVKKPEMCELEHHRSYTKEVCIHLFKKKLEVYGLLHYRLMPKMYKFYCTRYHSPWLASLTEPGPPFATP